ncbi:MAG: hypothetical protein WC959_03145 [Kiritimatiellales bacterium]
MKRCILAIVSMIIACGAFGDIIIQFGGNKDDAAEAAYQAEVGADKIVAWFGTDNAGNPATKTGSLKDKPAGATLTEISSGLVLTSVSITSTDPARTNTVVSGRALGINAAGSVYNDAVFNTAAQTTWTFEFNKDVTLQQLLFTGFNYLQDIAKITVEDGSTYEIYAQSTPVASWTGTQQDRVYTFDTPVTIAAGKKITVESLGTNDWGLGGIVVVIPEPATLNLFLISAVGIFGYRSLRLNK